MPAVSSPVNNMPAVNNMPSANDADNEVIDLTLDSDGDAPDEDLPSAPVAAAAPVQEGKEETRQDESSPPARGLETDPGRGP